MEVIQDKQSSRERWTKRWVGLLVLEVTGSQVATELHYKTRPPVFEQASADMSCGGSTNFRMQWRCIKKLRFDY